MAKIKAGESEKDIKSPSRGLFSEDKSRLWQITDALHIDDPQLWREIWLYHANAARNPKITSIDADLLWGLAAFFVLHNHSFQPNLRSIMDRIEPDFDPLPPSELLDAFHSMLAGFRIPEPKVTNYKTELKDELTTFATQTLSETPQKYLTTYINGLKLDWLKDRCDALLAGLPADFITHYSPKYVAAGVIYLVANAIGYPLGKVQFNKQFQLKQPKLTKIAAKIQAATHNDAKSNLKNTFSTATSEILPDLAPLSDQSRSPEIPMDPVWEMVWNKLHLPAYLESKYTPIFDHLSKDSTLKDIPKSWLAGLQGVIAHRDAFSYPINLSMMIRDLSPEPSSVSLPQAQKWLNELLKIEKVVYSVYGFIHDILYNFGLLHISRKDALIYSQIYRRLTISPHVDLNTIKEDPLTIALAVLDLICQTNDLSPKGLNYLEERLEIPSNRILAIIKPLKSIKMVMNCLKVSFESEENLPVATIDNQFLDEDRINDADIEDLIDLDIGIDQTANDAFIQQDAESPNVETAPQNVFAIETDSEPTNQSQPLLSEITPCTETELSPIPLIEHWHIQKIFYMDMIQAYELLRAYLKFQDFTDRWIWGLVGTIFARKSGIPLSLKKAFESLNLAPEEIYTKGNFQRFHAGYWIALATLNIPDLPLDNYIRMIIRNLPIKNPEQDRLLENYLIFLKTLNLAMIAEQKNADPLILAARIVWAELKALKISYTGHHMARLLDVDPANFTRKETHYFGDSDISTNPQNSELNTPLKLPESTHNTTKAKFQFRVIPANSNILQIAIDKIIPEMLTPLQVSDTVKRQLLKMVQETQDKIPLNSLKVANDQYPIELALALIVAAKTRDPKLYSMQALSTPKIAQKYSLNVKIINEMARIINASIWSAGEDNSTFLTSTMNDHISNTEMKDLNDIDTGQDLEEDSSSFARHPAAGSFGINANNKKNNEKSPQKLSEPRFLSEVTPLLEKKITPALLIQHWNIRDIYAEIMTRAFPRLRSNDQFKDFTDKKIWAIIGIIYARRSGIPLSTGKAYELLDLPAEDFYNRRFFQKFQFGYVHALKVLKIAELTITEYMATIIPNLPLKSTVLDQLSKTTPQFVDSIDFSAIITNHKLDLLIIAGAAILAEIHHFDVRYSAQELSQLLGLGRQALADLNKEIESRSRNFNPRLRHMANSPPAPHPELFIPPNELINQKYPKSRASKPQYPMVTPHILQLTIKETIPATLAQLNIGDPIKKQLLTTIAALKDHIPSNLLRVRDANSPIDLALALIITAKNRIPELKNEKALNYSNLMRPFRLNLTILLKMARIIDQAIPSNPNTNAVFSTMMDRITEEDMADIVDLDEDEPIDENVETFATNTDKDTAKIQAMMKQLNLSPDEIDVIFANNKTLRVFDDLPLSKRLAFAGFHALRAQGEPIMGQTFLKRYGQIFEFNIDPYQFEELYQQVAKDLLPALNPSQFIDPLMNHLQLSIDEKSRLRQFIDPLLLNFRITRPLVEENSLPNTIGISIRTRRPISESDLYPITNPKPLFYDDPVIIGAAILIFGLSYCLEQDAEYTTSSWKISLMAIRPWLEFISSQYFTSALLLKRFNLSTELESTFKYLLRQVSDIMTKDHELTVSQFDPEMMFKTDLNTETGIYQYLIPLWYLARSTGLPINDQELMAKVGLSYGNNISIMTDLRQEYNYVIRNLGWDPETPQQFISGLVQRISPRLPSENRGDLEREIQSQMESILTHYTPTVHNAMMDALDLWDISGEEYDVLCFAIGSLLLILKQKQIEIPLEIIQQCKLIDKTFWNLVYDEIQADIQRQIGDLDVNPEKILSTPEFLSVAPTELSEIGVLLPSESIASASKNPEEQRLFDHFYDFLQEHGILMTEDTFNERYEQFLDSELTPDEKSLFDQFFQVFPNSGEIEYDAIESYLVLRSDYKPLQRYEDLPESKYPVLLIGMISYIHAKTVNSDLSPKILLDFADNNGITISDQDLIKECEILETKLNRENSFAVNVRNKLGTQPIKKSSKENAYAIGSIQELLINPPKKLSESEISLIQQFIMAFKLPNSELNAIVKDYLHLRSKFTTEFGPKNILIGEICYYHAISLGITIPIETLLNDISRTTDPRYNIQLGPDMLENDYARVIAHLGGKKPKENNAKIFETQTSSFSIPNLESLPEVLKYMKFSPVAILGNPPDPIHDTFEGDIIFELISDNTLTPISELYENINPTIAPPLGVFAANIENPELKKLFDDVITFLKVPEIDADHYVVIYNDVKKKFPDILDEFVIDLIAYVKLINLKRFISFPRLLEKLGIDITTNRSQITELKNDWKEILDDHHPNMLSAEVPPVYKSLTYEMSGYLEFMNEQYEISLEDQELIKKMLNQNILISIYNQTTDDLGRDYGLIILLAVVASIEYQAIWSNFPETLDNYLRDQKVYFDSETQFTELITKVLVIFRENRIPKRSPINQIKPTVIGTLPSLHQNPSEIVNKPYKEENADQSNDEPYLLENEKLLTVKQLQEQNLDSIYSASKNIIRESGSHTMEFPQWLHDLQTNTNGGFSLIYPEDTLDLIDWNALTTLWKPTIEKILKKRGGQRAKELEQEKGIRETDLHLIAIEDKIKNCPLISEDDDIHYTFPIILLEDSTTQNELNKANFKYIIRDDKIICDKHTETVEKFAFPPEALMNLFPTKKELTLKDYNNTTVWIPIKVIRTQTALSLICNVENINKKLSFLIDTNAILDYDRVIEMKKSVNEWKTLVRRQYASRYLFYLWNQNKNIRLFTTYSVLKEVMRMSYVFSHQPQKTTI